MTAVEFWQSPRKVRNLFLLMAVLPQSLVLIFVVTVIGCHAWDDGAITLAFAKTFATTGRIALTPLSDPIEGFSTVSWFILNTGIALFHPSFAEAIAASQIMSGIFLTLGSYFMLKIGSYFQIRPFILSLLLLIYSLMGPAISEIANGMEMTLLAASGLAFIYYLYIFPQMYAACLFSLVFLLTRFEAIIYFVAFIIPLLHVRRLKPFLGLAFLGACVVVGMAAVRVTLFDRLVPNTILAKMQPPYSTLHNTLFSQRVVSFFECWFALLPLVGVFLFFIIDLKKMGQSLQKGLFAYRLPIILASYVLCAICLFSFVTGKNWGYFGRVQFLAFPIMLLGFGLFTVAFYPVLEKHFSRSYLCGTLVLTLILSWLLSTPYLLSYALENSIDSEISPAKYRLIGETVDHLRSELGQSSLTILSPDVGGLGLIGDHLRVIDLGLLTNGPLTKGGTRFFPRLLETEHPEIIEAHSFWATYVNLYEIPYFQSQYHPFFLNQIWFYIRNDLADNLVNRGKAHWSLKSERAWSSFIKSDHRYRVYYRATDQNALERADKLLIADTILAKKVSPQ